MGSPFDSEQLSEFQVNIFSNNRDIRLHLENSKSKTGHNFVNKSTASGAKYARSSVIFPHRMAFVRGRLMQ